VTELFIIPASSRIAALRSPMADVSDAGFITGAYKTVLGSETACFNFFG
jgi:hypothetical protein